MPPLILNPSQPGDGQKRRFLSLQHRFWPSQSLTLKITLKRFYDVKSFNLDRRCPQSHLSFSNLTALDAPRTPMSLILLLLASNHHLKKVFNINSPHAESELSFSSILPPKKRWCVCATPQSVSNRQSLSTSFLGVNARLRLQHLTLVA
jgi:hypothetical protein